MVTKLCVNCDTEFSVHKYRAKTARFCSHDCYWLSLHFVEPPNKGQRGIYHHTAEARAKIANAQIGRKYNAHSRAKMSASAKERGMPTAVIEASRTPTAIAKRTGPNHWNWKGGYQNKLLLNNQRRVAKLRAEGFHTLDEWNTLKEICNWTCQDCRRSEPDIQLTRDHIVPLTKGGTDFIENIQPLCGSCNSKKQNKTINFMELQDITTKL